MSGYTLDECDSFVMFREKTRKGWKFLTPKCDGTTKRVHAARLRLDKAEALIRENAADNPEFEFKIVPINRK